MPIEVGEPYLLFLKMISSVKEVLHHNTELDKVHMLVDIRNTTRDKHSQKRVYFNKEILPIGYIPCTVNDSFKLTFSTK